MNSPSPLTSVAEEKKTSMTKLSPNKLYIPIPGALAASTSALSQGNESDVSVRAKSTSNLAVTNSTSIPSPQKSGIVYDKPPSTPTEESWSSATLKRLKHVTDAGSSKTLSRLSRKIKDVISMTEMNDGIYS